MAGAVAFTIKLFAQLRDIAPIICNPAISVVALSVTEVSTFIQIVAPVLGVPEAARHGIVGAVGQPGWTYYLALEDERPVAGAAMFADGIGASACANSTIVPGFALMYEVFVSTSQVSLGVR